MSLADDVQAMGQRKRTTCKTGTWINGLDTRDRDTIRDYVAAGKPLAALWRAALKNGYDGGLTQFKAHLTHGCTCHRGMEIAA
ncbi:hypothetical protein [Nocardia wallacei]|uniref:hypothetical protein n=1 Tax=Nocardia wallacei TaxID=480035 RepID=UPI002453DF77|nr:hypothetical protein [Nocardia wallacei]